MRLLFTGLAILVLLLAALLAALKLLFEIPVTLMHEPLPDTYFIAILAVALLLAFGLMLELLLTRSRRREADAGEPTETRTRSRGTRGGAGRARVEWVDAATGMRLPAKYFLFSSEGVTPQAVRSAAEKYGRIMVGFDSGNIPDRALAAARDADAELSIYVEGPGGVTGTAWAPDEKARIKHAAASVGIHTDDRNWMKNWDDWGWKTYAFRQLENYKRNGYSACEIDNIDRVTDRDPAATIAFYKEFADKQSDGKLPRLIPKNLSVEQVTRLIQAIKAHDLPRSMFSEFHISEKGTGDDRAKLDMLTSTIGIRTVPSNDTYHYDAKGTFDLEQQYAALMTPPAPSPAGPSDAPPAANPAPAENPVA